MTETFKLKVTVGNANIELEGEGSLVHTIFTELREEGLGRLVAQENLVSSEYVIENDYNENKESINQEETASADVEDNKRTPLPNIKDIVIKNLPKTELEWILVYALYASNGGETTFTAEDLRQGYRDSNRFTETRNKNFSTNLKKAVTSNWFTSINNNDYALSAIGTEAAFEVLQRTSGASGKNTSKRANPSHTKPVYQMVDLHLDSKERKDIKDYFNSFQKLSNVDCVLVLVYWLTKHNKVEEVDENIIFTALRTVGNSTSFNIVSSLSNGKNRNNYYISGSGAGHFKLYYIGEDHVKELEEKRV